MGVAKGVLFFRRLRRGGATMSAQAASSQKPSGPKFYPGKGSRVAGVPVVSPSRRRDSTELGGPVEIPAITANLGGARALSHEAQEHLYFNYPPENANPLHQETLPPKVMPRS